MSSIQYSPVETKSLVTRPPEERGAIIEVDDISSPRPAETNIGDDAQHPLPPNPYIPQQHWLYLLFFLPLLTIFILPLAFALYVHTHDHITAPQWLDEFTIANPRITPQIVTILSSALTATARWGLGGAAALLARKRLLKPMPIFEIDMFASLKNISVVWDWKHRKRMMLLTWLLVIVCGLLTSGFVTLLNPLPLHVITQLASSKELDVATGIGSCMDWYYQQYRFIGVGSTGEALTMVTLDEARIFAGLVVLEHLTSKDPSLGIPTGSFVAMHYFLNYTRIVGTTGGALIIGPGAWQPVRSDSTPIFDFPKMVSQKLGYRSYTLNLQGFWVDATCYYDNNSPFSFTWQSLNTTHIRYRAVCPGSLNIEEGVASTALTHVYECLAGNAVREIYFRDVQSVPSIMTNLTCSLTPWVGEVDAVLHPDLQAFIISKNNYTAKSPVTQVANDLLRAIVNRTKTHFKRGLAENSLWGVAVAHVGESKTKEIWPDIMKQAVQAVFELEATYLRRDLVANLQDPKPGDPTTQPECLREVKVRSNDRVIGWEVKWSTVLGLVPLLIVSVIAFAMIVLAVMSAGRLTVFDPMSLVSMIAATSAGDVTFPKSLGSTSMVGSPLDEAVLTTKVSYGQEGQIWGLRSFEGERYELGVNLH